VHINILKEHTASIFSLAICSYHVVYSTSVPFICSVMVSIVFCGVIFSVDCWFRGILRRLSIPALLIRYESRSGDYVYAV
jgi:hypothetical protein